MDESLELPTLLPKVPLGDLAPEDDEGSSDEEDGGLDWTKLLPPSARPVIPKRGEKEFEPRAGGGSNLQLHVLDRARYAMFDTLRATRTISSKAISYASWHPDLARTQVTMARGIHFSNMGHSAPRPVEENGIQKVQKLLELLPEEAIYLIERGSLFCWKQTDLDLGQVPGLNDVNGSPMSVQQAYTEMIGREDLSLEKFQVYAYLKRLGYVVTRANPPDIHYPKPPIVSISKPTYSIMKHVKSLLRIWMTGVSRVLLGGFDWWKPVRISRWLHHDKNYVSLFKRLRFMTAGHNVPLKLSKSTLACKSSSPYRIFFNLYKPSTPFKKSAPPPPDFQVVVINARTTSMPTLQELADLFDILPEVSLPPPRRRRQLPGTPITTAVPKPEPPNTSISSRNAQSTLIRRLFPWKFSALSTNLSPPERKPNPFVALKTGKKVIIIAVVDAVMKLRDRLILDAGGFMDITFNPPIGESIRLATSLSSQTVPLYFTAQLATHDCNKLIQDGARVQLWSDLPCNGRSLSDGEWGSLDFTYKVQDTEETSSHNVSLGSTYIHAGEQKGTLFLDVVVALPMSRIPQFSFTYRIVYPSGEIKWLGIFGQNGLLSLERSDHDLLNFGLDSWTFDKSKMARIYQVTPSIGALDVARVINVYNYCVRAIGPTGFVSDLKEAALLFFVPRSQPSAMGLSPTCVFSASPGASLTFSADGHITASGSGTLLFQVIEDYSEPLTFIRQVLSHAKLDHWSILSWCVDPKAIVLATPEDKFPIQAVTIPLWRSRDFIGPIYLETNILFDMLGSTEFSIFSPDNMRIHLFTQATQKNPMVHLQTDSTGNSFVMSPVYTLQGYQAATDIIWKTVILSPYQVRDFPSDDSGILPTPPPSPPLQPNARLAPSDSQQTSISSQIPVNNSDEPEALPSLPINPNADAHDTFPVQKRSRSILKMFISLFYSVFFSIFYRFFWGNWTSGSSSRDGTRINLSHRFPWARGMMSLVRWMNMKGLGNSGDHDGFRASENLIGILETETLLEGNVEIQITQAQPSQLDAEIPEEATGYAVLGVSRASNNTKEGFDVYLQSEFSDSNSKITTKIALLCTTHEDSLDTATNANAPSIIYENEIMKHCVQFLDGSEPECVVGRCDVNDFCHGIVLGEQKIGSGSGYSCCLLQYQLECGSDAKTSDRAIRISPPVSIS